MKMTSNQHPFNLFESLLYQPSRPIAHIELHLERFEHSAKTFGFPIDRMAIKAAIEQYILSLNDSFKIRIILEPSGQWHIEHVAIPPMKARSLALAHRTYDSASPLWQHKTTSTHTRGFYQKSKATYLNDDLFDLIFINEHGHVSEGTSCNVFAELKPCGPMLTPPSSSGLLPGVMRQRVLADPKVNAMESIITADDLLKAHRVWITNSIRGMVPMQIKTPILCD